MKINSKVAFLIILIVSSCSAYIIYQAWSNQINLRILSNIQQPLTQAQIEQQAKMRQQQQSNYEAIIKDKEAKATAIRKQLQENSPYKKIDEPFIFGNIEYRVISAKNRGNDYGYQKTNGKFIEVKINTENIGKKETFLSRIFLIDSLNRQYTTNNWLIIPDSVDEEYWRYTIGIEGIKPGFNQKNNAVFEVAKDSSDLYLVFPNTEGAFIYKVDLGI